MKFPSTGIFGGIDSGKTFDMLEGKMFQNGEEI